MVKLFVYDGVLPKPAYHYSTATYPPNHQLGQALEKLPEIPDTMLVRTEFYPDMSHVGGLEAFLVTCLKNGHDRWNMDWGEGILPPMLDKLKNEGYNANDVIWATCWRRGERPAPFPLDGLRRLGSAATLVIDASAYIKELNTLYKQRDVAMRQRGLLSIILFDSERPAGLKSTREGLEFDISCPGGSKLQEAVRQISVAGYFVT